MTRNSVKFGYFILSNIFGDVAGGQKIIDLTLASVYTAGSALEFFVKLRLNFDYFRSQLFELCHIFDGCISCFNCGSLRHSDDQTCLGLIVLLYLYLITERMLEIIFCASGRFDFYYMICGFSIRFFPSYLLSHTTRA